jgi:hypothetical protein
VCEAACRLTHGELPGPAEERRESEAWALIWAKNVVPLSLRDEADRYANAVALRDVLAAAVGLTRGDAVRAEAIRRPAQRSVARCIRECGLLPPANNRFAPAPSKSSALGRGGGSVKATSESDVLGPLPKS